MQKDLRATLAQGATQWWIYIVEGPGGPPPPFLFWVKKEEMTERKKTSRASKSRPPPPPLAQGLDPPLLGNCEGGDKMRVNIQLSKSKPRHDVLQSHVPLLYIQSISARSSQ